MTPFYLKIYDQSPFEECYQGWRSYYPNWIAKTVLPKWKRKANRKHLPEVFRLAEMLCTEVRKDAVR